MIAIKHKCGAYVLVFWDQRITKAVLPDAQKRFERLGLDTYKKNGQWTEEGKKKYEKDIKDYYEELYCSYLYDHWDEITKTIEDKKRTCLKAQ